MNTNAGRTPGLLEPAPDVDSATAAALLRTHYGLDAAVRLLGSERDRTFLATTPDERRLVLKVSNSADDVAEIAMENAAMRHVAETDPGLLISRVLPALDGAAMVAVDAADGRRHQVRLMTAVPGTTAEETPLPARFPSGLGAACARMARALRGFGHPAAYRHIEWDPRAVSALRPFAGRLPDPDLRAPVEKLLDRFEGLPASTAALPAFVLHGDVTLSNVMVDTDGDLTGLIDFGDMHHTARVSDLAISLASLLRVAPDRWDAAGRFLDGYQRVTPLEPEEVEWLGELVLARLVTTVLISAWRAPLHPDKAEYVTGWDAGSQRGIDLLTEPGPAELAARFHRLCGTSRVRSVRRPDPTLLERRRAGLGGSLSPLFYDEPLQVVGAEGPWIHTADGRRYLDAYNNVPVVGHSHPAVVQAISRQAAVLNVNSRYLHPNVVELAERLTATMPPGLDTCVFVNSGSEANDLAWRMATVFTGRTGAIVTDCAYHGVSAATAALSTNTYPASARPPHVAVFPPPLPDASGAAASEAVDRARTALRRAGHDVALLAVDTVFSSGGILSPRAAFMRALEETTRAAGGLFLADEVQAGFGRGGRNLWRYLDFGLTPDFVTLGKPMGNGHPIAALVTRREIADRFAEADEYFSTFGGNPVSCAATLTVLDVVEQTGLVARSGAMGSRLREGLTAIAAEVSDTIQVRGQGLLAGVAIRPGEVPGLTASHLSERLRAAGVLTGTTGTGGEVLKIRPPLIWETEHVDLFLDAFRAEVRSVPGR
jgi:4-aminobutyrate aminotransferase-like enzyme